ncbi:MAG TPA: hypothetical protein VFO34_11180 [Candidatus Acidoferrales bacterium]|nr:hypothetical protein [Candidatus Acidoferrales bacterium]
MKRVIAIPLFALLIAGASFAGFHSLASGRVALASPSTAADLFADLPTATSPAAIYIDMKSLRASAFLSKIAAMAPEVKKDANYTEFVNATGFNYETDLDQVAIVTDPATQGNSAQVIAQGRFDEAKIAAYAQAKGKITAKSSGHHYEIKTDDAGNILTMEFISPNRLRVTSVSTKKSDSAANGSSAAPAAIPMREHISRVSDAALFAIFHVNGMKDMNAKPAGSMATTQMAQLAQSVQWVTLTGNPEATDLRISVEAECDTAANAQQLASGLNTLKMMAPMFLSQANSPQSTQQIPPEVVAALTQFISSFQISSDDTHAKLSVLFTQQIIDALSTMSKSRMSASR